MHAAVGSPPGMQRGARLPEAGGFCASCIRAATALILSDTAAHPVFAAHPAARSGIVFYAGAPVRTRAGVALGAICMTDQAPHPFFSEDLTVLEWLADGVAELVEAVPPLERLHDLLEGPTVTRAFLDVLVAAALRRAASARSESRGELRVGSKTSVRVLRVVGSRATPPPQAALAPLERSSDTAFLDTQELARVIAGDDDGQSGQSGQSGH